MIEDKLDDTPFPSYLILDFVNCQPIHVVFSYDRTSDYIPEKGDIIWINFDPQSGREQAGRRPALVIFPTGYNHRVKLIIVCPITTKVKGYFLEISLPQELPISGVILTDQVNLDYQTRRAEFICRLADDVLVQVISNVIRLLNHNIGIYLTEQKKI